MKSDVPEAPKVAPPVYAKSPEVDAENRASKLLELGRKGIASTRLQPRVGQPGQLLGTNGTVGTP